MQAKDRLTEDQVIAGVEYYLSHKGRTARKRLVRKAGAVRKEHGVDLIFKLENESGNGNWYFIEAKGNLRADRRAMRSRYDTNFRWALSQILLRIQVDSTKNNHIYGIAMPRSDLELVLPMVRNNWALKHLKIRFYGAYFNGETLTAKEYLPREIYD